MPDDIDIATALIESLAGNPALSAKTETFQACCELWVIFHDMAAVYYSNGPDGPIARNLELAEDIFQRLLRWADCLRMRLVRRESNSHAHTLMQSARTNRRS